MILARASERIAAVQEALDRAAADWLLVPASPDFRWLLGARAHESERLVAVAVPRAGAPFAVVPGLEAEALAAECPGLDLEVWGEADDPLARLTRRMGLRSDSTVLIGEGMRVAPLLELAARARCRPADEVIAPLRAVKDPEEQKLLALASRHADQVVERAAALLRPGLSERNVGRAIADFFAELGDEEVWSIVASGANAALPHHFTSDRELRDGEVVLLDLGAFTQGYASDITRTFWLGTPPAEFVEVYRLVDAARQAGIAAARAGVPAEEVDRAAREVIARAGYGAAFLHRTGHGVGLAIHEPPYLVAGNRQPLVAGMAHSVEPGIYLTGKFGVRLEDLVIVEPTGGRPLNAAPFDWRPPARRG